MTRRRIAIEGSLFAATYAFFLGFYTWAASFSFNWFLGIGLAVVILVRLAWMWRRGAG